MDLCQTEGRVELPSLMLHLRQHKAGPTREESELGSKPGSPKGTLCKDRAGFQQL